MVDITYPFPSGIPNTWNPKFIEARIYNAFDADPSTLPEFKGIHTAQFFVEVSFSRDLSVAEKTVLDDVMKEADLGLRPDTKGFTVVTIPDFTAKWKEIEAATGINIEYVYRNPLTNDLEFWVSGDLAAAKRNEIGAKLLALISITKY